MWVLLVGSKDRADNVDFVAETFRERRAKWAVDQPAGQNRLVRGLSFTTEERSWNLSSRVGPLFNVNGEGEEVHAFANAACSGCGDKDDGVSNTSDDCAVGELCKLSSFKAERAVSLSNWS